MFCRAYVNLPDWPRGQDRDVDPNDPVIQGWLRAPYIVPLVRKQEVEPPQGEKPDDEPPPKKKK